MSDRKHLTVPMPVLAEEKPTSLCNSLTEAQYEFAQLIAELLVKQWNQESTQHRKELSNESVQVCRESSPQPA